MGTALMRKKYILCLAAAIIAAGICVLLGWQFDITRLKSIVAGFTPMNPVTASTFLLSGCWLINSQYPNTPFFKPVSTVLAGIVTAIGFLHFVTYIFPEPSIRLDFLFFGDKLRATPIPTLVAPNTALVFTLSGLSMLLTHSPVKRIQLLRQGSILLAFCIVYISLVGYMFNVQYAYRFANYAAMALFTSLVFALLNIALFLCNTRYGLSRTVSSPFAGGKLLRNVLPFLLALPILLGYVRVLGEKQGLYPSEFGTGIFTFIFAVVIFAFICLYAAALNRRHIQQLRSEALIATKENKFRTLFNTLKEGVLSIDANGVVKFCNPSFCAILGYSERDIINKSAVTQFIPEKDHPIYYGVLANPETISPTSYNTQILKNGGQKIWVSMKMTPLKIENNEDGYLITISDITRERTRHEDLKAFSASAAHDLNSPLARIIMAIDLFEPENLTEDQQMLLEAMQGTATSMMQLLKDLLAYSQYGASDLEKTRLNLNAMVKKICDIETKNDFKGDLKLDELPEAIGNEGAVSQVFTNLVSNAVKYSSKKEHPVVEVGSKVQEKDVVYFVHDNGAGMEKEDLTELFKPFKRFHSSYQGNGMGLAIVKRIVEKHGGKIWVESQSGVGSTFYFTLSEN